MTEPSVALPSRYRLGEVIGEGGMGRVYRAHDATLGRDVAIKLIEASLPGKNATHQRERFVREARAAARLVHPNIVAVHDVDPEAGWLVMALVEGKPLTHQPMPATPALCRHIAQQVLAALVAAHAGGVIHRDIKPSNIMVGSDNHVTLVDFGVARLLDGELTRTGESLGTPAYMAPEQIRGAAVDARTDLYGLGATLYELVTGEYIIAFETPGPEAIAKLRTACGSDATLAAFVERCLQADPEARYASAAAAQAGLAGTSSTEVHRLTGAAWQRMQITARRRRRRIYAAIFAVVVAAGFVVLATRRTGKDPRLATAFELAQRGEYERAGGVLDDYLGEHPDDSEALALKLLADWWEGGVITEAAKRASDAHLDPAQRAMVRGIDLISSRRETEAAGYLATAEREHPGQVEIVFALGEAQWHAQQYELGAATLERAFFLDSRWQMALHHVIEFRLSRGELDQLRPIAAKLRELDGAAAAVLDCKMAIGERAYDKAVVVAQAALLREEPIAELHVCLAQAFALAGDLAAGERAATRAFELWPVDLREWGGFVHHAEHLLYRGKLDEYLALVREKPSRQRTFALAMWRPSPALRELSPIGPGMRMPPLGAAVFVLVGHVQGRDELAVYGDYPELEVRAYGFGLAAERRADWPAAIAHYREALAVPQKGDLRMVTAHHLARALRATGDTAGAADACRDVIAPRLYQPYRAILLPDCLLWSEDPARWKQLVDAWRGTFEHPAVVEARRRLAAP